MTGEKGNGSSGVQRWKRPPVSDLPTVTDGPVSTVTGGKRARLSSWKKPLCSDLVVPVDAPSSAGARQLVWHSVSLDEPMLGLVKAEGAEVNEYTKQALDPDRFTRLQASKCGCKSMCYSLFNWRQVLGICQLWHAMPPESQHHFLNAQWEGSADDHVGVEAAHRTNWFFAGQRVCFTALCGLLGVGNKTMAKKLQGVVDMRRNINDSVGMPSRPQLQANLVDMVFLELYHQCAEDLPETLHAKDVDAQISLDHNFEVEGDPQMYQRQISNITEIFSWTPEAALAQNIISLSSVDLSTVPCRHLPPGKPMGLYWQFQAWCEAVQAFAGHSSIKTPSWSVFWRMWSGKWSHVLRFRKRSQHKECNECHQFRESIQGKRKPPAEKMALACKWREHLRAQYHDRLIYWSLRWASRASMDVLTIILDSMDQCKTSWPQYPFHRKPACLENLERPRVVLSAVLCHGWCSNVFLSDDSLHHGASSTCELLCRSIDRVMQISERTGRPFPRHLVVQADNTTAQNKNSVVSLFLAHLASEGKFLTCTMNFLTVGHTHEDVDHYFSMLLSTVLRPHRFELPEDLAELIREKMKSFTLEKGEELFVDEVHHVRNFDQWLGKIGVSLRGCFVSRQGRLGAHSFVYKCRCHLSPREVENLPQDRAGVQGHDHDVFAMTKGRMHGASFLPPVLALPRQRVIDSALSTVPGPCRDLAEGAASQKRLATLTKLADTLEGLPHDFARSVARIREKVTLLEQGQSAETSEEAPPLVWLGRPPPERSEVPLTRNMYYEHLPDTSWQLLARFHRAPQNRE